MPRRRPAVRCTCTGFVALLRGINVGGKNPVPMAELRACVSDLGATDVATYIQSGNVLFDGGRRTATTWTRLIEPALTERFGYDASVVVLSHAQLRAVVHDAPAAFGREPGRYREDVVFLKPPMTAATAREQMRVKDGVDTVVVGDGVVYVARLETRATQSHFSKFVGTPAYKQSTIRNWRTTTKLLALLDEREEGLSGRRD